MRKHKSKKHKEDVKQIEEKFSMKLCEVSPKNMSSCFNRKPFIYMDFGINKKEIDLYSVRMFLNEEVVSSEVSNKGVGYTPRKQLGTGKYNVKVTFALKSNEKKELSWCFTIDKKDVKYKFFFGIPHCHTSYSSGSGYPYDAYEYARKKGLHFLTITDHVRRLKAKGVIKSKKSLRNVKDFNRWDATIYEADYLNKKHNKFLALVGFELSTTFWGHLNFYNTKDYVKSKFKNVNMLCNWLKDNEDTIIGINHPNQNTLKVKYSDELDKFVNLVEVGNGISPYKYVRSEEIYFKLLDEGWHLGAINSQDNHKANWGDKDNLTVIISEKLNKKSIFDAILNRRVYSTESRSLKLTVKVNDHWMGSIINVEKGKDIQFEINAEDKKNSIKKIQIISNGGSVIKEKEFNEKKIRWKYNTISKDTNTWYVVKVIQNNDKIAIASAIFG